MDNYIVYTYPCGTTRKLEIPPSAYRHYGLRCKGNRPIKAEVTGEISDEFLYKSLCYSLHPLRRLIIVNGKVIEDRDPDRNE